VDFRLTAEEASFRAEVAAFLAANLPDHLRFHCDGAQLSTRAQTLGWQRILYAKGWGAPHWPKAMGGTGWTPLQRLIFDMESALAGVPWANQQGMNLLGPVLNMFGTPEQRERFTKPLLRGETYWCQGFSEPGAGSDLASLQTAARREGDHYIVNGQKIWTSHAEHADWIFMLVRTAQSAKKQEGISFLLSPLNAPGITIRPIRSIDGLHHLTEVFFDDVAVPAENLIGEEGQGWSVAKAALGKERIFGACDIAGMLRELNRLKQVFAGQIARAGAGVIASNAMSRLARLDMEAEVISMTFLNAISGGGSDKRETMLSSILKVKVTELHQEIVELLYERMGDRGPLFYPDPTGGDAGRLLPGLDLDLSKVSSEMMYRRASSIYGGANEIQRDILAKAVLGA
jgi:acyl-CoA dehydrogenase